GDVFQGADLADRMVAELGVHAVLVVDDQPVLLTTDAGVVDAVLNPLFARQDAGQLRALALLLGLQVEVPDLAGDLGGGGDQQEALRAGGANAGPGAPDFLGVDQLILPDEGAERVAPDLVRAPGGVDLLVVDRVAADPGRAVEDIRDRLPDLLAGGQVAEVHGEALVARGVDGVSQAGAVEGDARRPEGEEVVPLGLGVDVEEDLLARVRGLRVDLRWGPILRIL